MKQLSSISNVARLWSALLFAILFGCAIAAASHHTAARHASAMSMSVGAAGEAGGADAQLAVRPSSTSPSTPTSASKSIFKRSFAGLGCLGVYDKAKFARLDRVCEECYQLYREPGIYTACR